MFNFLSTVNPILFGIKHFEDTIEFKWFGVDSELAIGAIIWKKKESKHRSRKKMVSADIGKSGVTHLQGPKC